MSDLEFFKSEVMEFDNVDLEIKHISDQVKPLNARLKELKTKKSELQGNICEYMSTNDIDTCNLKTGRLMYKESKTVKPLTQSDIKESIMTFFANVPDDFDKMTIAEKGKACVDYVYDENRETSVKSVLRRSK